MIGGGLLSVAGRVGRIARMTCEDALDLTSVFAQVARRQARDALYSARRAADRRARQRST